MAAKKEQSKRKRIRLGLLAHEPADQRFSHADAQARFLEAAAEEQPAVLTDLADEPLARFREVMWFRLDAAQDLDPPDALHVVSRWRSWEDFLREQHAFAQHHPHIDFGPLRQAIEAWAARWHLPDVPWVMTTALHTLAAWSVLPEPQHSWHHPELSIAEAVTPAEHRFELDVPGWDPTFETREQGMRRLRESFERNLHAHMDATDDQLKRAKFGSTPTKRGDDHWTWLAQRVVLGSTYEQIADTASDRRGDTISTESVHDAIHLVAALADLPLPAGKPGRRPKSSQQAKC